MKSSSSERGSDAQSFSPQGDSSNNEGKKPPGAHNRNFFVAFPLENTGIHEKLMIYFSFYNYGPI
jgi:hypothetical protein